VVLDRSGVDSGGILGGADGVESGGILVGFWLDLGKDGGRRGLKGDWGGEEPEQAIHEKDEGANASFLLFREAMSVVSKERKST
jgi:hypothetical protein